MSEYKELSCLAYDLRKKVVEMVVSGKGGHIGGEVSGREQLADDAAHGARKAAGGVAKGGG